MEENTDICRNEKINTGLLGKENMFRDETKEEMKRKKTRIERGTRKEITCDQQKVKPVGRYNEETN